jgi:hypothetical protein
MIKKRLIYWSSGTFIALLGVFTVRILSSRAAENYHIFLMPAGYSLAILGLFIITLGTKRKEL